MKKIDTQLVRPWFGTNMVINFFVKVLGFGLSLDIFQAKLNKMRWAKLSIRVLGFGLSFIGAGRLLHIELKTNMYINVQLWFEREPEKDFCKFDQTDRESHIC